MSTGVTFSSFDSFGHIAASSSLLGSPSALAIVHVRYPSNSGRSASPGLPHPRDRQVRPRLRPPLRASPAPSAMPSSVAPPIHGTPPCPSTPRTKRAPPRPPSTRIASSARIWSASLSADADGGKGVYYEYGGYLASPPPLLHPAVALSMPVPMPVRSDFPRGLTAAKIPAFRSARC